MPGKTFARSVLIGLLIAVQSYCLYSAVALIPVALALLAFQTFPMLLSLISWVGGGERPSRRVLFAMPVALVGLALALDVSGQERRHCGPLGRSRRRRALGDRRLDLVRHWRCS